MHAKVNCDENEALCRQDRWDIEGYPAVKVVRGSIVHDYHGPRFAPDIAAFMRQVAAFGPGDTLESLDGGGGGDDDDDFEGEDDDDEVLRVMTDFVGGCCRSLLRCVWRLFFIAASGVLGDWVCDW